MNLLLGDCLDVLKTLPDNSVDAVVTDPPYGLSFMGKKWDYDVPSVEIWAECLRVLKPGGHLLAFAGTRTQHRMAVRIEDAGFEIRDLVMWHYGSGFPKSANVSKGIDKAAGARGHDSVGFNVAGKTSGLGVIQRPELRSDHPDYVQPQGITPEARQWQGWGTALKPATEIVTMARKPLQGTVAANVLKWNTGALNIDGSRVQNQGSGQGGGSEENPRGSRFCPVHGLRNGGSQVEIKSGQSKVADNLQQKMPGPVNERTGQSELSGKVDNSKDWIHDGPAGFIADGNSKADSQGCSGSDGTSGRDGWGLGPMANTAGAHSSRQRGQAGQQAGKPRDIGGSSSQQGAPESLEKTCGAGSGEQNTPQCTCSNLGRWPANLIHDGSDEVVGLFPEANSARVGNPNNPHRGVNHTATSYGQGDGKTTHDFRDTGSAARFFYTAKTSKSERGAGNTHPTVKPIALMRYLCRLVTPPGGVVLDPFMGSGTTGKSALLEGFDFIGIERDPKYFAIAEARVNGDPISVDEDDASDQEQERQSSLFDMLGEA